VYSTPSRPAENGGRQSDGQGQFLKILIYLDLPIGAGTARHRGLQKMATNNEITRFIYKPYSTHMFGIQRAKAGLEKMAANRVMARDILKKS
jgi:hypothetical protein